MSFSPAEIGELRNRWLCENAAPAAHNHQCAIFNCRLVALAVDLFICPCSGNVHRCGVHCDNAEENEGRFTCRYTAMVLEDTVVTRHSGLTEWMGRHDEFRGEKRQASDLQSDLDSATFGPSRDDASIETSRVARRVCLRQTPANTVTRSIYELIHIVVLRFLSDHNGVQVSKESARKITKAKELTLTAALRRPSKRNTLALAELLVREVDEIVPAADIISFASPKNKRIFSVDISMKILRILWTVINVDPEKMGLLFFKCGPKKIGVNEVAIVVFTLLCIFGWFPTGVSLCLDDGHEYCLLPEHQFFVAFQDQQAARLPQIRDGFNVLAKVNVRMLNSMIRVMDRDIRRLLLDAMNSFRAKRNETAVKFGTIDICSNALSLGFNDFGRSLI